jgi:hypothetical protein
MSGAVSALFLLDIKGRVLIWRDYRGDVSALQAERFFTKLIEKVVFFLNSFLVLICGDFLRFASFLFGLIRLVAEKTRFFALCVFWLFLFPSSAKLGST